MTERVKENENLQITLTLSVTVVTVLDHHQKFNFSLRRNRKKNSYERRAYESVDDKSIS